MNLYFVAASIACFITFAIHTWLGGPPTVGPLLKSRDMHDVAKYTNYYCWHLVTIVLVAMACSFGWASLYSDGIELAWLAFLLSTSFMLWSLVLVVWKKQRFFELPQWTLFACISAIGGWGLIM